MYWTATARDAELHLTQQTAGNGVVTSQTFDANTGLLTGITAGSSGAVESFSYTYDTLGKLLTRGDTNTGLAESFGYDSLNRLTSTSVNLTPTPLNKSFTYSVTGNLTSKSDVGTYTYPASGQPRPHAVSPLNFTDPSGYCFLGCFWKPIFAAIQNLFRSVPVNRHRAFTPDRPAIETPLAPRPRCSIRAGPPRPVDSLNHICADPGIPPRFNRIGFCAW